MCSTPCLGCWSTNTLPVLSVHDWVWVGKGLSFLVPEQAWGLQLNCLLPQIASVHQLTAPREDMFSDKKKRITEIQSRVPLLPFHWCATQLHPHPVL